MIGSMSRVSRVLDNSSTKTTEKYYVQARRSATRLTRFLRECD
jgi:hypothetical protein